MTAIDPVPTPFDPWPLGADPGAPRISDPGELVAVIPYQLGFQPRSSLVVMGLREVGRACAGAARHESHGLGRIDLPTRPQDAAAVAGALARALLTAAPDDALVVVYGPAQVPLGAAPRHPEEPLDPGEPALDAVDALLAHLELAGVGVLDVLYVDDGRLLALTCTGEGCCPPQGRTLPTPADVPAVAELVGRGAAPSADRQALADGVRAGTDPLAAEVARLLPAARRRQERAPVQDRTMLRRWHAVLLEPALARAGDPRRVTPLPAPVELARLVAELESDEVGLAARPPRALRDAVLAWCDGDEEMMACLPDQVSAPARAVLGQVPVDQGQRVAVVDRLADIVRALPPEACAGPSALLACLAWRAGDPVRARQAAEQALAADPGQRLARLVRAAAEHGVAARREAR